MSEKKLTASPFPSRHPGWMQAILARTAHLNNGSTRVVRLPYKKRPDNHQTGNSVARVLTEGTWKD